MPQRKVAITGIGLCAACGTTPKAFFDGLCKGIRRFTPASLLADSAMDRPFLGVDASLFAGAHRLTAQGTLALARHAARQALQQSCGKGNTGSLGQMGVCAGTTSGSALHFLNGYALARQGEAGPFKDVQDFCNCNLALALAQEFAATGPVNTICTACASGADALGLAMEYLDCGLCDTMLCGGADALSLVPHSGFARLMVYDAEPCKPFDLHRNGLNLGEGAAFFVLETEEHTLRRGAKILGRLLGYGSAGDAHHLTAPHPEGRGLEKAIHFALEQAQCQASDIAFINAHATGTHENDKVEGSCLHRLFPDTPVWASKACTGHTLGAAGALEAAATLLALNAGRLPASYGFETLDPEIGVQPTMTESVPSSPYAMSTSLAFGGCNAALILQGSDHD